MVGSQTARAARPRPTIPLQQTILCVAELLINLRGSHHAAQPSETQTGGPPPWPRDMSILGTRKLWGCGLSAVGCQLWLWLLHSIGGGVCARRHQIIRLLIHAWDSSRQRRPPLIERIPWVISLLHSPQSLDCFRTGETHSVNRLGWCKVAIPLLESRTGLPHWPTQLSCRLKAAERLWAVGRQVQGRDAASDS